MKERILLHGLAQTLKEKEIEQVSGGAQPANLTRGQPTRRSSSPDPQGPQDDDTATADW